MRHPDPINRLINELTKLPGVGPKTAQRLAYHLVYRPAGDVAALAAALVDAKEKMKYCSVCFNLTDVDPCIICSDRTRDRTIVCVVEDPRDVVAIEKVRVFRGLYHVLHGAISPMEGIGPEALRIKELFTRLKAPEVAEVILATSTDIEGEATAMYLTRLLKESGLKITRLARGLPVGTELEYADEVTLTRALEGRREY
ncbi:MAG: recombination mediator RecR [Bacillota bacterium]